MCIRLENVYPRSAQLFRTLQAANGLGVNGLIEGLLSLSALADDPSDSILQSFVQYLSQLSKVIEGMSQFRAWGKLESLQARPIFPVIAGNSSLESELRSSQDQDWYIADRPHLRHSFIGKVALLNISAAEVEQMENLFSCLGLHHKKLSVCVTSRTDLKGPIKLRASDSDFLQSRALFFEAYADPHTSSYLFIPFQRRLESAYTN